MDSRCFLLTNVLFILFFVGLVTDRMPVWNQLMSRSRGGYGANPSYGFGGRSNQQSSLWNLLFSSYQTPFSKPIDY